MDPYRSPDLTPSQRLRFAATLIAITLVAAACGACAGVPRTGNESGGRSPRQQHLAAVEIRIACLTEDGELARYHGSGVVIDEHRILTANHVVSCHEGVIAALTVVLDEKEVEATVDRQVDGVDIARIRIAESLGEHLTPVTLGPRPELGDAVCEYSVVPHRVWRCGIVQMPDEDGLMRLELLVNHGNSGSGLYDSRGRLVGIVVQWYPTEGGEHHGGKAEPLSGEWLR